MACYHLRAILPDQRASLVRQSTKEAALGAVNRRTSTEGSVNRTTDHRCGHRYTSCHRPLTMLSISPCLVRRCSALGGIRLSRGYQNRFHDIPAFTSRAVYHLFFVGFFLFWLCRLIYLILPNILFSVSFLLQRCSGLGIVTLIIFSPFPWFFRTFL
jgi:hypothetical protein